MSWPLLVASLVAASEPPPDAPPPDVPPPEAPPARLTPWIDMGFGLPTGLLGLSFEGRYGPAALEAGAGMGAGGLQLMVHAWGHLFPVDSFGSLALGVGYSTGAVPSRGDLGGLVGPDSRYARAHWLNLLLAPFFRIEDQGGPVLRAVFGTMINLAPEPEDEARMLFIFGASFGWEFAP